MIFYQCHLLFQLNNLKFLFKNKYESLNINDPICSDINLFEFLGKQLNGILLFKFCNALIKND